MDKSHIKYDQLIFRPDDVDLARSPLRSGLKDTKTFVLGAFNPGLCRLANGNLLLMVRVAEALSSPVVGDQAYAIRWEKDNQFTTDAWPLSSIDMQDPRKFKIKGYAFPVYALTSLSWLLPVELNPDGSGVEQIHYDKIISPKATSQEYGIEDPRISVIDGRYYMTTCCVSAERHSTMLYDSGNGLDYVCRGILLDHQNKDMLLFEGKIKGAYCALTRPLGECYFASPPSSDWHPGAGIHISTSPDLLYWKPCDKSFLRARRSSVSNVKIGGGTPPVLTRDGWLMIYHGVENNGAAGIYRSFWALLDADDPVKILRLEDDPPLLESAAGLTAEISHQVYIKDIVFTTGIAVHGDDFILASGESDLACRITIISREFFSIGNDGA
jgi:beta-1,2-mannobiose phosphorylase / 1,2-beta-oligomannan phosphorylase